MHSKHHSRHNSNYDNTRFGGSVDRNQGNYSRQNLVRKAILDYTGPQDYNNQQSFLPSSSED